MWILLASHESNSGSSWGSKGVTGSRFWYRLQSGAEVWENGAKVGGKHQTISVQKGKLDSLNYNTAKQACLQLQSLDWSCWETSGETSCGRAGIVTQVSAKNEQDLEDSRSPKERQLGQPKLEEHHTLEECSQCPLPFLSLPFSWTCHWELATFPPSIILAWHCFLLLCETETQATNPKNPGHGKGPTNESAPDTQEEPLHPWPLC